MNLQRILCAVLVLGSTAIPSQRVFGQTKVALHATHAEVDIWKKRATNGPYKDGWNIIKNRADAWVASPESRWAGNTTTACYNASTHGMPARSRDRGMRDAGFVYLLTGTTSYRDAILTQLLNQVKLTGTDFGNTTKWCVPVSGNFEVSDWVRRLVYAYSYIRDGISEADRTTLDTWFSNAAYFFEASVHHPIAQRFPNRLQDNYSACVSTCPGTNQGLLYFGGPMAQSFHAAWNNQSATRVALIAAVGVVLNDSALKARAKRFVQEWLKFAVWPDGEVFDQYRWNGLTPQNGYGYATTAMGSIITVADHLARAGDTSLYDFSTSEGMFGTKGGPKSLLKVMQHFAALTNGTITEYASTTPTTDPAKRIYPFSAAYNSIGYINLAPANVYYKDSAVKTAYSTTIPGSYMTGGYDPLGGDWGSYPHILFMFGQQENAVWPYPTGKPEPSRPVPPTDLVVTPKGS